MKRFAFLLALAFGTAALIGVAQAQVPPQLDHLQRADGAKIVPERFLRSWDPVTLFFDHDIGPANGGPEDDPAHLVKMTPQMPGAWQWLGPRALQFRPADAWTPLTPVEIEAEGVKTRLVPLLPVPVSTTPTEQSEPTTDLDRIVLTFDDPVDIGALTRLLSIELRPSPGIEASGGQMLGSQDYVVQALERSKTRRQAILCGPAQEFDSRRPRGNPAIAPIG